MTRPVTAIPARYMAVSILVALSGCGNAPDAGSDGVRVGGEADSAEPAYGDTLVTVLDAEPAHLNVLLSTSDASASYIGSYIFETLLDVDDDTLEMIPRLAKEWEISDDHLEYTFYLRDDVAFSDGTPLTAEDVKFTYEAITDSAHDTANLRNYLQDIESVEVIDPHTVRFTMSKPYFRHLIVLGLFEIYPKHVYSEGDFNNHKNNRSPVGSGPYVFDRWDTGQRIVLTRNENYWGEPPYIESLTWKVIQEDTAAFQSLVKHDVDMYQQVPPETWARRTNTEKFEREFHKLTPDSPIPGFLSRFNYIGWNMRKPQLADKRVRQALCMLFDRQLIIDEVWAGYGTIIVSTIFHKMPEYNDDIEPWPFDPERAKKLLDEAGWVDRDRDGVREKDGVNLEFELSFAANIPEYEQLGSVYQEELRKAGVRMHLNNLEWATFQERVHKRTFDACMLAWLTVVAPDPYQLWHSSQAEDGSNYPGFKNAEADRILEEARQEFDHEKRIKMYHRFQEILHEEQPYIFLYARPGLVAVDKRFHNTVIHTAGLDPLDWWVPAGMQRYR